MAEPVDPVKNGLELLSTRLADCEPKRQDAKKKGSVERMRECVDAVQDRCSRYRATCPIYFPESQRLEPFFQALTECRNLPTESEAEKRAFIVNADECLSRLRSEVVELLASR